MHNLVLPLVALVVLVVHPARADRPVTDEERPKLVSAVAAEGCSGGKMEQETEASGIYEVDDAKCHGGQYDIKLDKEFKVILISRD